MVGIDNGKLACGDGRLEVLFVVGEGFYLRHCEFGGAGQARDAAFEDFDRLFFALIVL